ncbi:MAG: D-2-hydroxyacid dehydrogenase [Oscillospiraceae bacterium]|nr:D-2-hydroxyacid dehydrogenase [Oscillospiraceae bacterium]
MKIVLLEEKTVSSGDISLAGFSALGDVTGYPLTPQDKVIERTSGFDAAIINKTLFTADVIEALPSLRYIGLCATGYNNVDIAAAKAHCITVTNVPTYSANAVAEQVFGYILYFAKRIHEQDAFTREGGWIRSDTFSYLGIPAFELYGKTIGIVGMGNIGRRVAEIARAFGMEVLCATRTPKDVPGVTFTDTDTVFSRSDYITLHCPLTDKTAGMADARLFSLCKPTAVFINTSRGGTVDEQALADALTQGRLAGAALDVLTYEPMHADCPLYGIPNCIITPHTGWAPRETRVRLVDIAVDNLRRWIGGSPVNTVT